MPDINDLERRCVERVLALGACTPLEGVRAVLAEAGVAELVAAAMAVNQTAVATASGKAAVSREVFDNLAAALAKVQP